MRKILLFLTVVSISGIIHAQVGINTENPQGVFHVDGQGNTNGNSNISDDVIVDEHGQIGIGGLPATSASVALQSDTMAFMPNRVALTASDDIVTIPSPETGSIVYNTATAGTTPFDVTPGLYCFNGLVWTRMKTLDNVNVRDIRNLQSNLSVPVGTSSGAPVSGAMNFGTITIPADGAYAFLLNLLGQFTYTAASGTTSYVFLYSNGNIVDCAEINMGIIATNELSYTLLLAADLKAGDNVQLRIGYYTNIGVKSWTLKSGTGLDANKTTLTFWKI